MDEQKRKFREYLDDALARARRALTPSERQSWLTIAASWALLLGIDLRREPPDDNPQDAHKPPRGSEHDT